MDADMFLQVQYASLREEIRETKARIFTLAAAGLIVVPGAEVLVRSLGLSTARLGLPLLVMCVGLLYVSEQRALMRCGRYIRQHIEPRVPGVVGWETWLEQRDEARRRGDEPRSVSRYLAWAYALLLTSYYAIAVASASQAMRQQWPGLPAAAITLATVYSVVGIGFLGAVATVARTTRDATEAGADR